MKDEQSKALSEIVEEFRNIVDNAYGTYLDSMDGFKYVREESERREKEGKAHFERLIKDRPDLKLTWDGSIKAYGRQVGADQDGLNVHLHQAPHEELMERNKPDGTNSVISAQSFVLLVDSYWEETFRAKIAACLGLADKDSIVVPLFGDIRKMRNSILKSRGLVGKKNCRFEVFNWFQEGDLVELDRDKIGRIVDKIMEFCEMLKCEPSQFVRSPS